MHDSKFWFAAALVSAVVACGSDPLPSDDDDDDGQGPSGSQASVGGSTSSDMPTSSGMGGAGGITSGNGASGPTGSGGGAPSVSLNASGDCSPSFDGTISVATNSDSLAVYSQNASGMDSSIQVALQGATGLQQLSTQHRVDTGIVINLIDDGATWTNIASFEPDPVTGTLDIIANEQSDGVVHLSFTGATLVLTGTQPSYCTLSGTVQTYGTYFGQ